MERDGERITEESDQQFIWHLWVSGPLNKEADLLVRWSRTSFFGGSPTSKLKEFDGIGYVLFFKCSEEWTLKYALASALSNYEHLRLTRCGEDVALEPFLKDLTPESGTLLGDAASMDRNGGNC